MQTVSNNPFAAFASANYIQMESVKLLANPRGNDSAWPEGASHFQCVFERLCSGRPNVKMSAMYSMGSAHKGGPQIADVLECLQSDARAGESSWREFRMEFGSDRDDLRLMYDVCERTRDDLEAFLGPDVFRAFIALEEEG